MISACDVERCVAKLTRALERNYSQLNDALEFDVWNIKVERYTNLKSTRMKKMYWQVLHVILTNTFFLYRQSPVKIFFRICSEFFSDLLVLMLWYIVWYYGMFITPEWIEGAINDFLQMFVDDVTRTINDGIMNKSETIQINRIWIELKVTPDTTLVQNVLLSHCRSATNSQFLTKFSQS